MPTRVEFEELAEEVQTAIAALALQLRVRHPAFIHVQLTWNGVANDGVPIVDVVTALDAPVPGPPALYAVPDLEEP